MSTAEPSQPHDSLFRFTFGQPQEAISFFQGYLPDVVTSAVKWDELKILNSSFVDENLRQSESDMLYQVPWAEEPSGATDADRAANSLFLYILFEHQSTPHRKMPRRLLKYMLRAWDEFDAQNPTAPGLPPIVPFVLSHTPGGWKLSPYFHDQIQWPNSPEVRAFLEAYQPRFEHGLLDLTATPFAGLLGTPSVKFTLGLLKGRSRNDDGTWIDWALPIMADVQVTERGLQALPTLLRYLFNVVELNPEEFRAKIAASPLFDKSAETIMTLAAQLRNEGIEEGLSKGIQLGREEGREEGRLNAQIEMVQNLQRVLGCPVSLAAALAQHSTTQLGAMIERLMQDINRPV